MDSNIKTTENEILNFAMTKLNHFKRIHFGSLAEVINNRFSVTGIKTLLWEQLIKTKRAELKRGYLIMPNDFINPAFQL